MVSTMRLAAVFRSLLHISPAEPGTRPLRVRVLAGTQAGRLGWCNEAKRVLAGEIAIIPVDVDDGPHVHLHAGEFEIVTEGTKQQ